MRERMQRTCRERDVRRSQDPRQSDWLVANAGVTNVASLQNSQVLGGISGFASYDVRASLVLSWEFRGF